MARLPSYHEAVQGPDALSLAAPYISPSSYPPLCRVSRHCYRCFAPLLWQDPLVRVRLLGLDPGDDLVWYRRFIDRCANTVRRETRLLVRSLDFRHFAPPSAALFSTDASESVIPNSFKVLHRLFPDLACLLLDGHPDLDPSLLALHARSAGAADEASHLRSLRLLDLARCGQEMSPRLLDFGYFRDLHFLNVSHVPGSFISALKSSLNPRCLPSLRILKAQGREINDAVAQALCQTFQRQLWSLDLSHNRLTDAAVDDLTRHCIGFSYQSDLHFQVEGKLVMPRSVGTLHHGPFSFIAESAQSPTFSHSERYLADAPVFFPAEHAERARDQRGFRENELPLLRRDDAGGVKLALLDNTENLCDRETFVESETGLPRHGGLTHLYLNGNRLTSAGLSKLVRLSGGALRHLECSTSLMAAIDPNAGNGWGNVQMQAILGASHLFRPVISSNLRSLRVHHSLVTNTPTVTSSDLSPGACLNVSEKVLARNVWKAFPQAFVPDLNPRLVELTLTGLPQRSTGAVTGQLIRFLELVALQERNIRQAKIQFQGKGSVVLPGIRRIRLEIGSDADLHPQDAFYSNLETLLDPGHTDFGLDTPSFLGEETTSITSRTGLDTQSRNRLSARRVGNISSWTSGRLEEYPYSQQDGEHLSWRIEAADSWTGNVSSIPVWIGSGQLGPHHAVNHYMWNLRDPNLRVDPGPATPDHVAAGVPPMSFLFYGAWDAMVFSESLQEALDCCHGNQSHDIVAAIRAHRERTRATTSHYGGSLEVLYAQGQH